MRARARFERGDVSGAGVQLRGDRIRAAVAEAVEFNRKEFERARASGRWRSSCFGFVHRLKQAPEFGALTGPEALAEVRPWLSAVGKESAWDALPPCDTKGEAVSDPEALFLGTWASYKRPALEEAVEVARAHPVPLKELAGASGNAQFFASVLAHLAAKAPDEKMPIAVNAFGAALRVTGRTVGHLRASLVELGVLEEVEPAQAKKLAAVYRWHGPFPCHSCKGTGRRKGSGQTGVAPSCLECAGDGSIAR